MYEDDFTTASLDRVLEEVAAAKARGVKIAYDWSEVSVTVSFSAEQWAAIDPETQRLLIREYGRYAPVSPSSGDGRS